MPNMSYCRFHNTEMDLDDCLENIHDDLDEGEMEWIGRANLIDLCHRIIEETEDCEYGQEKP